MLARDQEIHTDGPRPMLDRVQENEIVIGVLGALFTALFVTGLMAWALARFTVQAAHSLRPRIG